MEISKWIGEMSDVKFFVVPATGQMCLVAHGMELPISQGECWMLCKV